MKTYFYVISGRFASDDAMSMRVMSFCTILKETGNDVVVISLDDSEPYKIQKHRGIKYVSISSSSRTLLSRISNYLQFKQRLKKILTEMSAEVEVAGVFFYDIAPDAVLFLKKYTQKNKIKLFHDSVEWYSPKQFKWGRLALAYLLKNFLNTRLIDKRVSVFAISKYLQYHFENKGIATTRVPIMLDMQDVLSEKEISKDKLVLLYAGSPGKKDYLKEIVGGLANLKEEDLEKVRFHIFGINEKQLTELCLVPAAVIEKCRKSLIVHGRVKRNVVLDYMKQANFTVLLRSTTLRYAKAGFPTKVVESLATATPVMCNITSDLGDYLTDGVNALLVEDCSEEAFKNTLEKALTLSWEQRNDLCLNARKTAEANFDYRNFITQFESFIKEK